MSQKLFHICNIIAEDDSDYKTILEYLGNYPVFISKSFPDEMYFNIPTLVIGWNFVKNKFINQNIFNKEIGKNLFWSFSKTEKEKEFFSEIENFFTESVKEWLPKKNKLFDSYIHNESLQDFLKNNINSDKKIFLFFSEGALYIHNNGNEFVINVKSLSTTHKNFKEILTNVINSYNVIVFSYNNLSGYVNFDDLKDVIAIDTLRWVKYGVETLESYFNIIPNFKVDKYIPFLMSKLNSIELDSEEQLFYKRMCQREKITCWLSSRDIAFELNFDNKKLDFKLRRGYKLAKVNYSNKRTITGRIQSHDVYNPQNLDKSNDDRKQIISRFEGGKILVFDYISFEPKMALYLSGDKEFIEEYWDTDLHYEVADLLFVDDEITDEQRKFAKTITNPLIYGEGEKSLLKKLATQFSNPEEQLYKVRQFLKPILDKSEEVRKFYKSNGYILTPWNYIIRPEKEHAYFNNYMQTYASEIMIDKLFEIRMLLRPYKTQFLFQVHDSLVFDLSPTETFLVEKITDTLSKHKNMIFGVNSSIGLNYKDLY